ncbi:SRPBCC domain-containing protein [uncultured Draconibacterium sp.]|uniref:SRPBCC domain-containing protein n=1 Tax=uncultured Draconibacterium sp. TaxID=1573823 RepID=UPI0025E6508D|nr:SRPBCC domain-containing protein [uncultured Draconibacterium sp.]
MAKPVGKTKDVGFQFGLQKTFPISEPKAWDFMFSDAGLKIWLGELVKSLELKKEYRTKDGINGLVRVFKPNSHIRMNWKKKEWENMSTVQVRVIGKGKNRTLISFHQEKLTDFNQRAEMKEYWNEKMDKITKEIKKASR